MPRILMGKRRPSKERKGRPRTADQTFSWNKNRGGPRRRVLLNEIKKMEIQKEIDSTLSSGGKINGRKSGRV